MAYIGQCLLIHEYKPHKVGVLNSYSVLLIPKNASSWLRYNLLGTAQSIEHFNRNTVCVLRDPLDRWTSGVAEFLSSPGGKYVSTEQVLESFIVHNTALDLHTLPQNKFVSKLDESATMWFYLDQQFTENFFTWASDNRLTVHNKSTKKINNTVDIATKSKLVEYYKDLANKDSELKNKLLDFYKEDFDLIQRVKFYGK